MILFLGKFRLSLAKILSTGFHLSKFIAQGIEDIL